MSLPASTNVSTAVSQVIAGSAAVVSTLPQDFGTLYKENPLEALEVLCKDIGAIGLPKDQEEKARGSVEHINLAASSKEIIAGDLRGALILVPKGEQKSFSREALVSTPGATTTMVLFPNFPAEIRHNIYRHSVVGRSVDLSITDTGSKWIGVSCPRPALLLASREAVQYLCRCEYSGVLAWGATLFSPRVDKVNMKLVSNLTRSNGPLIQHLLLPAAFGGLTNLSIQVENVHDGVPWAIANARGLFRLRSLTITVKTRIANEHQGPVTFEIDSRDVQGTRAEYLHFLNVEERTYIELDAMRQLSNLLVDRNEVQDVLNIFTRLDIALINYQNRYPNFPSRVLTVLHWDY